MFRSQQELALERVGVEVKILEGEHPIRAYGALPSDAKGTEEVGIRHL